MTIVSINGNPYTTAQQDLDLQKIKSLLQKALGFEVQRALFAAQDGELLIDTTGMHQYFELTYVIGRAREKDHRQPTETERKRLGEIIAEALDRLGKQIETMILESRDQRAPFVPGPVLEQIDQAYYAGREDGAR